MSQPITFSDLQSVHGPARAQQVLEVVESLAGIRAELLALDETERFDQALTALCAINFATHE